MYPKGNEFTHIVTPWVTLLSFLRASSLTVILWCMSLSPLSSFWQKIQIRSTYSFGQYRYELDLSIMLQVLETTYNGSDIVHTFVLT